MRKKAQPEAIEIEGDVSIPYLEWSADLFLDRTTIVNGPSNTGKTVIVQNIMNVLRHDIDQILVISPTEPSNKSYEEYVDAPLIHYRLWLPDPKNPKSKDDSKGAQRFLEAIWSRQEMLSTMHAKANNLRLLTILFSKLPESIVKEGSARLDKLATLRDSMREDILSKNRGLNQDQVAAVKANVHNRYLVAVKGILKRYIRENRELYAKIQLTTDEHCALEYLDINPRLLLVFDDCAAQLKGVMRKMVFSQFFFQGRHNFITSIYCEQDDSGLLPELRKNAFVTFFTTSIVCRAYFTRNTNKFPKETQKHIESIIGHFFRSKGDNMAYIRDDPKQKNIYFAKTGLVRPFKFGSPALQKLCKTVKTDNVVMDTDNPFYSRFVRK